MSDFVVSARKYRPIRFDSVVGQSHIASTLKNAIRRNHIAQAFLFCGPRGVGKTTCARILAKVLNCQRPTADIEPCDECDSCRAFRENASLNVYELDAASNNSVEHIRALIEQVRFAPQSGRYKIYIIDEVHMLSQAAFNAFLKTLEEPPSYAIFILATTEKHKIIPTILSRCQIFDFNRIQIADMSEHLQSICIRENIEAEEEALHVIAQKADGALRDALSIFDRVVSFSGNRLRYQDVIEQLNILDYEYYFKILDAIVAEDVADLLLLFDTVQRKGFEGDIFINGLAEHLRNILVCKYPDTVALLEVSEGVRRRYQEQAQTTPTSLLLSALHLADECDVHYKLARNKRLHVELCLIRMAHIMQATRLSRLPATANGNESEKKKPDINQNTAPQSPKQEDSVQQPSDQFVPLQEEPKEEQPEPKKSNFKEKLAAKKGKNLLKEIEESVLEEKQKESAPPPPLTPEALAEQWEAYAQCLTSPFQQAYLRKAKLDLDAQTGLLSVTVASKIAQEAIRTDDELWRRLGAYFKRDKFETEYRIEEPAESPAQQPAKKNNVQMDEREKYRHFRQLNPLVDELQKRFKLFPPKK